MRAVLRMIGRILGLTIEGVGVVLVAAITVFLAILRLTAATGANRGRPRTFHEEYVPSGGGDDGFDQYGYPMTPGEEASSYVKRKRLF